MAVDFTIPISWIKGPDCEVKGGSKCKLIETSFNEKIKSSIKTIKGKLRRSHPNEVDEKPITS